MVCNDIFRDPFNNGGLLTNYYDMKKIKPIISRLHDGETYYKLYSVHGGGKIKYVDWDFDKKVLESQLKKNPDMYKIFTYNQVN